MKRNTLAYVQNQRGMPWVEIGMVIEVDGRRGVIKGGNDSGNLDVILDGQKHKQNCHPSWKTKYYRDDKVIAEDGKLLVQRRSTGDEPEDRDGWH